MKCPDCRWQGRAIQVYRARPSRKHTLMCPACYIEVKVYVAPKGGRLKRYQGAVD